jgi:hypothetical protein
MRIASWAGVVNDQQMQWGDVSHAMAGMTAMGMVAKAHPLGMVAKAQDLLLPPTTTWAPLLAAHV